MKTFKAILLSALLALFLSGREGFCSWTLNSNFLLTLPNNFVDQEVDEIFKNGHTLVFPVANQIFNSGYQVALSGINVNVSYPSTIVTTISSGRSWQLTSSQVAAQITIGEVNATQTVSEVVNGVNLNLQLNAVCSNVVLQLPAGGATISAVTSLNVEPSGVVTQVNPFAMQWAANAWQIAPFTCTGAAGFEQLVISEITQYLSNPNTFQPMVQQYIQNSLSQTVATGLGQLLSGLTINTQRTDITAAVTAQSLGSSASGYSLWGVLNIQLPLAMPGQNVMETCAPLPSTVSALNSTEAYLTLPEGMITALLSQIQNTSLLNLAFTSNQVPGIKSLIGSRFDQFFLFPNLFSFSTSAVFDFTTSDAAPVVATITDAMKTVDSFLLGGITGDVTSVMNAPKNGTYVPYVDFKMPFSSKINVSVANGAISCKFSGTKLNLSASWDPTYKKLYDPDGWIATGTIGGGIQSYLTSAPVVIQLPNVNLQNLLILQAVSLEHHPSTQTINVYLNNPN